MTRASQCKRIIQYLKEHGVITTRDAVTKLNIMSLSRRMTDLGRMGHTIGKRMVRNPLTKIAHMEYRLIKEAVMVICGHAKKCASICGHKKQHIKNHLYSDYCKAHYCRRADDKLTRCVKVKQ